MPFYWVFPRVELQKFSFTRHSKQPFKGNVPNLCSVQQVKKLVSPVLLMAVCLLLHHLE
jgi:hypothetical protein